MKATRLYRTKVAECANNPADNDGILPLMDDEGLLTTSPRVKEFVRTVWG